jgi:hypothetical protein
MNICEKHRKFAAYWEEIGGPDIEYLDDDGAWVLDSGLPCWFEESDYRIAGDRHFALRKKWVDSDKTLPIEYKVPADDCWYLATNYPWSQNCEYREAVEKHESSALQTQVGGSHYKDMKIQPAEYTHANGIGHLAGDAIAYISRYKSKNGRQDLEKAIHSIQLLIQLEYGE